MKLNLMLATLVVSSSCAFQSPRYAERTQSDQVYREIATLRLDEKDMSPREINRKLNKIFYSYIIGHKLLAKFDQSLDQESSPMDTAVYSQLQVVRAHVDAIEEEVLELQVKLVAISTLPNFSEKEKSQAQRGLKLIEKFNEGKDIPLSLRHTVLGNFRAKQAIVIDRVEDLLGDEKLNKSNLETLNQLEVYRDRYSKNKSTHNLESINVEVKINEFEEVEKSLERNDEYSSYLAQVHKEAQELRSAHKEKSKNILLSDEVIFPASGKAGNITGNTFPAKTWSLTYDDGPNAKNSPAVLKVLKEKETKATFFMLAKQVVALPDTAKSIAKAGMEIASHSYDHPQLIKLSGAALDKQISTSKKVIEDKLDTKIALFRLPYGAGVSNTTIRNKIAAEKMVHVFWNVDTLDWQDKNPTSIYNRAVKQMANSSKNSGVILFHDIHAQTVEASRMLIDYMKKNGLKICPVQSVVDQINKNTADCK